MLQVDIQEPPAPARRVTRRNCIQAGSLAIGGLTLPDLLAARASAAARGVGVRDKSVVLLWLDGGPPQHETFDPKMDTAPSEICSMTGETKTSLPGVTFGGTFGKLAKWAHRMAVVRSCQFGPTAHPQAVKFVLSGGDPLLRASMGSLYASVAGPNDSHSGMPNYVLANRGAVDPRRQREDKIEVTGAHAAGKLGSAFSPFDPSGGGEILENMRLSLPSHRLGDRLALCDQLDALGRRLETSPEIQSASKFQQQAVDVLRSTAADTFDLAKEDPRTLKLYGIEDPDVHRNGSTLPKQMLLARRLCEAGCGFVTVTDSQWDTHKDHLGGMHRLTPAVDTAVAGFLEDVEQRGMSDQILLVITGEFGRTPVVNKNGGRDHWSRLSTLAFAGGGLPMGQVIGASDRMGSAPRSTPVKINHVLGTIMHTLLVPGEVRLRGDIPQQVNQVLAGCSPIPELA